MTSKPKPSPLRQRVQEALHGVGRRRPATYDLDGPDAGKVRVMLRGGYDKAVIVRRLCNAGLSCKPKGDWVDAWFDPAESLRRAVEEALKDVGRPEYVPTVYGLPDGGVQVVANWRVRDEAFETLKREGFEVAANAWPNWLDVKGRAPAEKGGAA